MLCAATGLCGGIKVIAEWVTRLSSRGHDAEWWGLEQAPGWFSRPIPYRRFPSTDALGAAMQQEEDACWVATWWQTAFWINPNLRGNSLGFFLVQDDDAVTYSGNTSGDCYRLGLKHITESQWVTQCLKDRYSVEAVNVGIGIDHEVFKPLGIPRDHDRIFTTYRPQAGPNDLKGFGLALQVAQLVRKENHRASLVTFGGHSRPRVPVGLPHVHVQSPSDAKLRELYSQAGCYLMSSKHEGLGLPGLEALACGTPLVCTDAGGNMEYSLHGLTAAVGDTPESLASNILYFQRNTDQARVFGEAGREIALKYRWDDVIDKLEAVLVSRA
jgi:glycosyltransferase involved in cell wall biosynthesis